MSDTQFGSSDELRKGILRGEVPRQVRLFAAQGLLPVSREDLIRLQLVLSADPDPELAESAVSSLEQEDLGVLKAWLENADIMPLELDLLIRVRQEEEIWGPVASHPGVSDETLRVLAQHGTPLVQDIVITNQTRILGCLELLDDLRSNRSVGQVVLRRVREFEEEFIEKLAAGHLLGEEVGGPTIEEALVALKAIGGHVPAEETLPYPTTEDPKLAEIVERLGVTTYERLLKLNIKQQILTAMKGSREERTILINSRKRLVFRAVLASPKITNIEVERYASSRSVSEDVLRIIASRLSWLRLHPVVLALAHNPKTPVPVAMGLLTKLAPRDLLKVGRDRNLSPAVRRRAQDIMDRKH